MHAWLLVGLTFNAAFALLAAAFLAGSLRRWSLVGYGLLTVAAFVVLALLLGSSVDSLPSAFESNPIAVAKRVWVTSDYGVVIKGILIGVPLQLLGFRG